MMEITKHRAAFFDSLGVLESEVTSIRGLVIAGKVTDAIRPQLKKYRQMPLHDSIDFHTYQYLSAELEELAVSLAS